VSLILSSVLAFGYTSMVTANNEYQDVLTEYQKTDNPVITDKLIENQSVANGIYKELLDNVSDEEYGGAYFNGDNLVINVLDENIDPESKIKEFNIKFKDKIETKVTRFSMQELDDVFNHFSTFDMMEEYTISCIGISAQNNKVVFYINEKIYEDENSLNEAKEKIYKQIDSIINKSDYRDLADFQKGFGIELLTR
jgi:hypothetical protein